MSQGMMYLYEFIRDKGRSSSLIKEGQVHSLKAPFFNEETITIIST